MDKNKNIEENNEFDKLRALLNDLPKVGTPDNFEYKLMTRIQNKNFEIKSEKKKNIFLWVYTPAFALVASVVLIFFVLTDNSIDSENPWNSQPKLIPELQTSETAAVSNNAQTRVKEKASNQLAEKKRSSARTKAPVKQLTKPNIQQNSIAANTKAKPVYPFDKSESVDLDKLLTSDETEAAPSNSLSQPHLASQSNTSAFESPFSGFFIKQREAAARRESLRVREDSLRRLKKTDTEK